jgi:hypothetical protein
MNCALLGSDEVLMAASMKKAVFSVVGVTRIMEAAGTSETLVDFYQTTQCYNL